MPSLSLSNINVDFPKDPYQCQIDYMSKVITALEHGTNALLESPTGTGKTLCLICSTLAWQNHIRKRKIDIQAANISLHAKQPGNISDSFKFQNQATQPFTSMYFDI